MRKAEMGRRIAGETDLTQIKAAEAVETIFNEIKRALQHGERRVGDPARLWGISRTRQTCPHRSQPQN
jgi:hypothetical protein